MKSLQVANVVLLAVNIALFSLWFSMIRRDAIPVGGEAASYLLNQVSAQVTVLGIMIAVGAVILGGLGIFGFQTILERAESKAEKVALQTVAQRWDDFLRRGAPVAALQSARGPLPDAPDATEAKDA